MPTVDFPWVKCNLCGYKQEWKGDQKCIQCKGWMDFDLIALAIALWSEKKPERKELAR